MHTTHLLEDLNMATSRDFRTTKDFNSLSQKGIWTFNGKPIAVMVVDKGAKGTRIVPIEDAVRNLLPDNDGSKTGSRVVPNEQVEYTEKVKKTSTGSKGTPLTLADLGLE